MAVLLQPVAVLVLTVAVLLQPVAVLLQPVAVLLRPAAMLLQAVAGGGTAAPRSPQRGIWRWPVEFHEMKEEMAKALEFFHASVHHVAVTEQHKADC